MYKHLDNAISMFYESTSILIGSFWASKEDHDKIIEAVDRLRDNDPFFVTATITPITHNKTPPSLFRTNDFTDPFQVIVETFSIPKYKEVNPALLTTVTFPFLFGVMFGDVAHGAALLIIAIVISTSEDMARSKALKPLYDIRYMLIFMGFFATYSGFIYNDFMGVKMVNWSSCYVEEGELLTRKNEDCVYPVGFDHVWGFAKNEISYLNSFKMKFSIIIGFCQMMVGICFKGSRESN